MRFIYNAFLLTAFLLLAGCTTSQLSIYDFDTKKPIANAFVYINEHKMFNPFNASDIYLTDEQGNVNISESLKDGQVSVFVGKEGYDLNLFTRNFEQQDNIRLFVKKTACPKIKNLLIANDRKKTLLRDFYLYCSEKKIDFCEFPSRKIISIE